MRSDPSLSPQAQEGWEEFPHLSLGLQAPGNLDCPGNHRPLSEDGPPGGDGSEIPEENQEGHGMQSEDLGLYPEALRSH